MSRYVVNWQQADGQPGWHPVADVQEATACVERLRNADGVDGARIYRLDEVAFEFKPYFKVELAVPSTSFATRIVSEPEPAPAVVDPLAEVEAPAPPPPPPVEVEVEPVAAPSWSTVLDAEGEAESANGSGRRGLFGR